MNPRQIGVWIDHACAQLVELSNGITVGTKTILSETDGHHRATGQNDVALPGYLGGNAETNQLNHREEHLRRFYDRVIAEVTTDDVMLVLGPGEAKTELVNRMGQTHGLADRVIGVEAASKMTEHQIAARLREVVASAISGEERANSPVG